MAYLIMLFALFSTTVLWSQEQTLRGRVLDRDSKQGIVGAVVQIFPRELAVGTDEQGFFRFDNLPIGTYRLRIEALGFDPYETERLVLTSAKALELQLELQPWAVAGDEVVVTAGQYAHRPLNELSVVSTRSFSVEETQRYASSINDPSRMAMGFAGVRPSQDNNADIIVRGNSPLGLLWRLEGLDIPNPNHFARRGSSGGGITIFSASLLSNSDFSTGAFAAEYGNAFSSVFDMRFRKGNNEAREHTIRAGIIGLDVATEGPFRKGQGSYLVNYRYSTLGLLNRFGLYLVGENINNTFQDLSFNLAFPSADRKRQWTVFGLGGISNELTSPLDLARRELPADAIKNDFLTRSGVLGATLTQTLSERAYLRIVAGAMASRVVFRDDTLASGGGLVNLSDEDYTEARYSLNLTHHFKLNNQWLFKSGIYASHLQYAVGHTENQAQDTLLWGRGGTQLLQAFGQTRYRPWQKLTVLAGFHALFLTLNNTYSLEPRLALRYDLGKGHDLALAYGLHGRMLPIGSYFYQAADGSNPNRNLPFMQSQHWVLAYNWYSSRKTHLGLECYYQNLAKVPVSQSNQMTYWLLNDRDGYLNQAAQALGRGENYGLDLTLEQFFHNRFFFLFASSIFRSQYQALDGRWHRTRYDAGFNNSLLLGKEWHFGNKGDLQLGARVMYAGSLRYTPADSLASAQAGVLVRDFSQPFHLQVRPYFRVDGRIAYRRSFKNSFMTLAFDGQNMSMRTNFNPDREVFNPVRQELYFVRQSGLIPVLSMQLDFR